MGPMRVLRAPLAVALASMVAGPGASALRAQTEPVRVTAGERLPGVEGVRERSGRFLLLVDRNGELDPSSILFRHVTVGELDGGEVLWLVERYRLEGRTAVDSTALAPSTLLPIHNASHGPRMDAAIDFVGTRIVGETTAPGEAPRRLDLTVGQPVYLAASLPEILAALPLAPGYAARLTLYDPGRGVFELVARVAGVDAWPAAGGPAIETWRVEVAGGGAPSTIWIAKEGREHLRIVTPLPDGGRFLRERLTGP